MRVRLLGLAPLLVLPVIAAAQNPNVLITLDARLQWRAAKGEDGRVRAFDLLGRHSVVALLFSLEPGFDVTISERFQKIPGDADHEQLDEYFIEDKGYWRFGKQYVPFGRNTVVRESLYAGRLNVRIGSGAIPATLCYVQGERNRPNGFVFRIGERFGASVALGERFAQNATALTVIRRPEDSLGSGHGYGRMFGVDFSLRLSPSVQMEVDHVSMRQGERIEDVSMDVTDVALVWRDAPNVRAELALTREWIGRTTMVRIGGEYPVHDGISIEPHFRLRNGKFYDLALTVRIKP